jgi:hypothetical protein
VQELMMVFFLMMKISISKTVTKILVQKQMAMTLLTMTH